MRLHYFVGLFTLLFLISFPVFAQEVQGLLELLSSIHTLQGDFIQTTFDNKGKTVQRSEGKVALQRPGHFRWEAIRPIPQIIVANNTRLWIYDPDLQQVVIHSATKTLGQTPAFLLSNVVQTLDKDFLVKRMPATGNWQWFNLMPKNHNSMFQAIQLGFQNHEIKKMRMQDNLGHSTVVEFKRIKVNVDLSSSLFVLRFSSHVDVIDETHT